MRTDEKFMSVQAKTECIGYEWTEQRGGNSAGEAEAQVDSCALGGRMD